jgi:hypothetical protein
VSRVAIVCGSAVSLWADLTRAQALEPAALLIAANDAGQLLARVDHLVSIHPEYVAWIRAGRRLRDHVAPDDQPITHSIRPHPGVDRTWPQTWTGGSSGLLAVRIALALGHERVILAGMPIEDGPRVMDDPRTPPRWPAGGAPTEVYQKIWADMAETNAAFRQRVRSCSGWTARLLGEPWPTS